MHGSTGMPWPSGALAARHISHREALVAAVAFMYRALSDSHDKSPPAVRRPRPPAVRSPMTAIRVQMNVLTSAILEALQRLTSSSEPRPISFADGVAWLPDHPGLHVQGYGTVSLPLVDSIDYIPEAPGVFRFCQRTAPIRAGYSSTCCELAVDRFEFTNPAWDTGLQQLVQHVKKELGCAEVRPVLVV